MLPARRSGPTGELETRSVTAGSTGPADVAAKAPSASHAIVSLDVVRFVKSFRVFLKKPPRAGGCEVENGAGEESFDELRLVVWAKAVCPPRHMTVTSDVETRKRRAERLILPDKEY